jgi:hypothetical protein
LIDRIVEAKLARFDQLEHRERIEGLADRRGLETRTWGHRLIGLRHAVPISRDDLAVLDDGEARPGTLCCPRSEDEWSIPGRINSRRI